MKIMVDIMFWYTCHIFGPYLYSFCFGLLEVSCIINSCFIIIIIDNRGLNARWCLTPLLLSLPTTAYLGQRGLTPAGCPTPLLNVI